MRFLLLIILGLSFTACVDESSDVEKVELVENVYDIKNGNRFPKEGELPTIYELYSLKTQEDGLETLELIAKVTPSGWENFNGCFTVNESRFPLVIKEAPKETGEESDEVIRVEEPTHFKVRDTNTTDSSDSIAEGAGGPWLFNFAEYFFDEQTSFTTEAFIYKSDVSPCLDNTTNVDELL